MSVEVADDVFEPGQLWRLAGTFRGKAPVATVLRVEEDPVMGRIVHLRVDGAGAPHAPWFVSHAPFTKGAALHSLYGPLGRCLALPDFARDYEAWLRAVRAGQGVVFTVPVAEAVEEMIRSARAARRL